MCQNEKADNNIGVKFESTNKTEIGSVAISLNKLIDIRADYVGHMATMVRKRRRLNVSRTPVNIEPNICDDQQQRCLTQR